jgi:hypothetical protein
MKILSIAATVVAVAAAVSWGASPPAWLLTSVLALILILALAYGFMAAQPRLDWLYSRPVQGAALVCLGAVAIFVPLQFVISALFIGMGTRRVWAAACSVEAEARTQVGKSAEVIGQEGWELVPEEPAAGELEAPVTTPASANIRARNAGCRLC